MFSPFDLGPFDGWSFITGLSLGMILGAVFMVVSFVVWLIIDK